MLMPFFFVEQFTKQSQREKKRKLKITVELKQSMEEQQSRLNWELKLTTNAASDFSSSHVYDEHPTDSATERRTDGIREF